MATTVDFIEYGCEQISGVDIRYRKMFGEYMVYVNDKPILYLNKSMKIIGSRIA